MRLHTLPEPVTLADLVGINEQSRSRTPGCHVTDIVKAILIKIDPKRYAKDYGDASENWQQAGFLWEEIFALVLARQANMATRWRPGELTKDRIIGSPDAFCVEPLLTVPARLGDDPAPAYTVENALVVEEYKCTWKGAKGFDLYDKRFLWWLLQLQAYCYMAGTTYARLYVLHINGTYEGFIPMTTAFLLDFPQMELDEQWTSFLNTAKSEGLL